jgi:hypothetical protein
MKQPSIITSRFATPMETADVLGVPRRRAKWLISLISQVSGRVKENGVPPVKKKAASRKRKLSKRQTRAKFSKAAR